MSPHSSILSHLDLKHRKYYSYKPGGLCYTKIAHFNLFYQHTVSDPSFVNYYLSSCYVVHNKSVIIRFVLNIVSTIISRQI